MAERPRTMKVQTVREAFAYPYVLAVAIVEGADPDGFTRITREKITVGRDESCELILEDPAVSGFHCAIHVRGTVFEVVDLDSRNGTRLNGKPLMPNVRQRLKHMDEIAIGDTRMIFTANRITGG
ncbi:MAG: FHA domain-containing protein [Deltaproteobacteria bacterium]|nr:FHA domain-containing protein [Deltaproteobacteria bacterium]